MHDEQLTRIFRSLKEQADPDPAFTDALYARLEREAGGSRRRISAPWALLAAALLLAGAVGAAVAVGSGLVKLPFAVAIASPTPEPRATPVSSATPVPAESASPVPAASTSPTPTPSVSPAAGAIVIGGLAKSTVDGLNVRATAGTAGTRLGTINTGQTGFVVAGPVSADGYAWYQLSALGLPPNAGCEPPVRTTPFTCPDWLGWVAGGQPGGRAWLEATTLPCASSPMNVEALVSDSAALGSRTPLERLACYGSTPIRVRGWFPQIPEGAGSGGTCGPASPVSWLVCQNINDNGLVASESAGFSSPWVKVTIDPSSGVTMPARGQWVEVVGHLDDAAARDCTPLGGGDQDPIRVVLTCRTELVVESVHPVAGPY